MLYYSDEKSHGIRGLGMLLETIYSQESQSNHGNRFHETNIGPPEKACSMAINVQFKLHVSIHA